ncbi:ras-related C3 botulinum toxin substrate 1-like [Bolinopsis microptera]|uniref:ras-related C3 botulinum toxin substrate 1-like n=1 Tax=Bolinopsis microptera TaxID=2820187 RepID=UPI0030799962
MADVITLKTIAVGYGGVGKTCMCIRFARGEFPHEHVPTVFDNYCVDGEVNGQSYKLALWDTGGGEDYHRLRPLSYPETDVFLLLFDVAGSLVDFEEIHSYWWTELHHHCPDVPIILVGAKIDLRDNGLTTISTGEGEGMAKKIGAAKYMEISSLKNTGVTELFEEVVSTGIHYNTTVKRKKKKKRKCIIL